MAVRFTRLTRPSIRQLRPGEKITERGITADCLNNGDVRYSVNIMVAGERIHRVVGRESEGTTRTQAEEFIEAKRTEAREGRLNLPKGRQLPLTFRAAAKLYLDRQRETGAKNLGSKERHLRRHLIPYLGNMSLDRITTFTLEKFRKNRYEARLSVATVNRILATYRHMARRLYDWKKLRSPLPTIPLEKEMNERDYVLSTADEDDLLEAALADSNTYIWLFIKVGLGSAMRHSEILSARFDHFDTESRRLRVKVKGGHWRDQPLTRELTQILLRERDMAADRDGWIFPSKGTNSGHAESMADPFKRCIKAAGLDPVRVVPHTLRHTAITRFANTRPRPTLATLQKFSGHLSLTALARYLHAGARDVDEALDQMEAERTLEERERLAKQHRS